MALRGVELGAKSATLESPGRPQNVAYILDRVVLLIFMA